MVRHIIFLTTIDDANATNTTSPVATAATGPTVYIHLPSSTPILVLILILILIIIMIVIVILFLQTVFLPKLYNYFHCLFRTGRALLLLILLSDSGGLDSDTYYAGCYCYSWSYSIRSFIADFFDLEMCYCFSFLLSTIFFLSSQSHQIQILSSRDPTTIWIH